MPRAVEPLFFLTILSSSSGAEGREEFLYILFASGVSFTGRQDMSITTYVGKGTEYLLKFKVM